MISRDSMTFVDPPLDDHAISVVEALISNHMLGNYKEVRNIILGHDSRTDKWISKYGKRLAREDIDCRQYYHTLLKDKQCEESIDSFGKKGMIFYSDDNIYSSVRIDMDDSVRHTLEVMFTISENVIEYRKIIDIIIAEWNAKNVKDSILSNETQISLDTCGSCRLHYVDTKEKLWKELRRISRNKGLIIRDSFKQALIDFLESRTCLIYQDD